MRGVRPRPSPPFSLIPFTPVSSPAVVSPNTDAFLWRAVFYRRLRRRQTNPDPVTLMDASRLREMSSGHLPLYCTLAMVIARNARGYINVFHCHETILSGISSSWDQDLTRIEADVISISRRTKMMPLHRDRNIIDVNNILSRSQHKKFKSHRNCCQVRAAIFVNIYLKSALHNWRMKNDYFNLRVSLRGNELIREWRINV